MIRPQILIDSEGNAGLANGPVGNKKEIVDQPVLGTSDVGMHVQVSKYFEGNRTQSGGNLVSGEGGTAQLPIYGFGCRRVENLTFQNGRTVTWIRLTCLATPRYQ